jgi:hypothetical protein
MGRGSHADRRTRAAQFASPGRGLYGGSVENLPSLGDDDEESAEVAVGTIVAVGASVGRTCTFNCRAWPLNKGVLEIGSVVPVISFTVVFIPTSHDALLILRRTVRMRRNKRLPFL